MSHAHDDKYGPKSAHTLREEQDKAGTRGTDLSEVGPARYNGADQSNGPYYRPNELSMEAPNFMAADSNFMATDLNIPAQVAGHAAGQQPK